MAAGNDEADGGEFRIFLSGVGFQEDGVNVSFEMIDGDERLPKCEGENFAVREADEESAGEAGTLRDGDSVEIGEGDVGLVECFANDGNDFAEMFAGGKLGNDAAEFAVNVNLRGDDAREDAASTGDDGGGRFVAGGFDAQDQIFFRVQGASFHNTLS